MKYQYFDEKYDEYLSHADIQITKDMKYGLPDKKKYPMPDRDHVLSAIKFFNYVSPKDESELAKHILARMEEYGIDEVNVGPDNRFGKYYKKTELKHHQIKGAKHGVRRWQNEDGSWTPEGRLRYGKGGAPRGSYKDLDKSDARAALEKGPDAYRTKKEYLEAIAKDCLPFDCGPSEYMTRQEIRDRADAAAVLGIKALAKSDPSMIDTDNDINNPDQGLKDWFVYEDQTIGMAMIADLINQGYTAEECNKLIDDAEKYCRTENLDSRSDGMVFDITEGNYNGVLKSFAKACESIKKDEIVDKSSNLPPKNVNITQLKNDILATSDNSRLNHELVKNLATKDSVRNLAETTQNGYEKYQSAAEKFRSIDETKKTDSDRQEFQKARDAYKAYLKEVADDALGESKNDKVKFAYEWDGGVYRDGEETASESLQEALWRANVERNRTMSEKSKLSKLEKTQSKREALEAKKESPKYQRDVEKRNQIEEKLNKLHLKTQRIRDDKLFRDKDPGFFDRMKINKERRLEKRLNKLDKKFNKMDKSIDKLTKKENKLQKAANYKYDERTREAMREARTNGYSSLTEAQKQLLREVAYFNE